MPPEVLLAQAQPPAQPPNVEANIASLHQRVQITPAQEAQFNAVANVMRQNARAEASAPQSPPANASAVDDLRAYIQYGEMELAGMKRFLPALEALYATLSPAQKQGRRCDLSPGSGRMTKNARTWPDRAVLCTMPAIEWKGSGRHV